VILLDLGEREFEGLAAVEGLIRHGYLRSVVFG
jgi:hypothetical protein